MSRLSTRILCGVVTACGLFRPLAAAAAPQYTVADVTVPGKLWTTAEAMNASGQVVGFIENVPNIDPFLYDGHQFINLSGRVFNGAALGINDLGAIVGTWHDVTNNAFLYEKGQVTDLAQSAGYTAYSSIEATDINNVGQIAGDGRLSRDAFPGPQFSAFIYENGSITLLGGLPGVTDLQSTAAAINDAGQVVGDAYTTTGLKHAYLYSAGQMMDLGTLGGDESNSNRINNLGVVVGRAQNAAGVWRAFRYTDGQMIDIGGPADAQSSANGINNLGDIVGGIHVDGVSHPFLLSHDGEFFDLTPFAQSVIPDLSHTFGEEINDSG